MSFENLRNALVKMPSTGPDGFEGLAALLLSALTADVFYVARSGDQPADALSAAGDVAMQGKRYDRTPLDETDFEGDFHKACRLCPKLDCYVLAATRATAQLNSLARELENRTGIDVILLQFDAPESELPALCVTFWDRIKSFPKLSELCSDFAAWAAGEAQRPELIGTIERMRGALTKSVPLAATVQRKLKSYLHGRFGIDASSSRPSRFRIELPVAVLRCGPEQQLDDWWKQGKTKAAVVGGEEGMGKSWAVSAFCYHLIQHSAALILWLDSADWSGLPNLEGVLDAGLMQAGLSDPELRKRLVRKAMDRWPDKLLIVLDGVNERAARDTAQRLLVQLHAAEVAPCRLLFTTRPIPWKSDECSLWKSVTPIPVGPFTEEELKEALARLPVPIPRNELPNGLVEVAKVPRYFRRATELRERFSSLANVTKEMVLWAELLAKVEAGDPQVTTQIGWTSPADVKRALLKLASAARAIQTNAQAATDSYCLLQTSFGDKFEQIRSDLAEQRIVLEPTSENPAPSPEHLVLGFALHLGSVAAMHPSDSVSDLADRLRKELEPVLAQDQLTEALFVALQLSAFPNSEGHTLSSYARSALLLAWASSQNSWVEAPRLTFWANQDLMAYLDFVEEVFVEPVSDGWSSVIIAPLMEVWCALALEISPLHTRLRRWLKLVWKSHDFTASSELTVDGHDLPTARSQSQLALSFVALAVLSERADVSFLPDLAIAWATHNVSTQRHSWPKQPNGDVVESDDFGCKDMTYNLGALLRWRYTEMCKPNIELLRAPHDTDKLMLKGLEYISQAFDRFGWVRSSIHEALLREKKPFFPAARHECQNRVFGCPELAARDDLPDLCANDQEVIAEKVEHVFSSKELHSGFSMTHEDLELEYHLSWFAKYRPDKLVQLGTRFRLACLDRCEVAPSLNFTNRLPFSASVVTSSDLLAKAKACAEREYTGVVQRFYWSLLQLHILALTCLGERELKDWLIFASERKPLRREIHMYPIRILCPLTLPNALASFAREQAKRCCDEPEDVSDASESEFDFWAYIGGLAGEPDLAFNAWAGEQIKLRQPTGNRRYYWLLLWFRSIPQPVLQEAVSIGSVMGFLADEGLWALTSAGRCVYDWDKFPVDFNSLADLLPIDDLGTVLVNADRRADLAKWGHQIFNKALELVGKPPFERSFWGTTILTVGDSGEISGSSCDREEGPGNALSEGLRPKLQDQFAMLHNPIPREEFNRRANEGIRIWRDDQARLKTVERGAFNRFEARHALRAWRDQHPDQFRKYASELLTQVVSQPGKAFHIGGFIGCVIDALVSLEPDLAKKTDAALRDSSLRVNVINDYGVSTFTAAFWRAAGDGNIRCQEVCGRFVQECSTDEELMYHAITAQAEGAREDLLSICRRLLGAPLAKDRCLVVSLLAWVPGQGEIKQLEQLITDDPSGWVQKHAEWAVECAKEEASVRRHYERTLKEADRNLVQARLLVLLPALTPSAHWWHRDLESKSEVFDTAPRDVQAALAFFWYDTQSECKKTPKPFGRTLSEYLRGERIHDLRSPKPRLMDARTHAV